MSKGTWLNVWYSSGDPKSLATLEPVPGEVLERVESVEVSVGEGERATFQIVFRAGRAKKDATDDPMVSAPALAMFNRIALEVVFEGTAWPLYQGIITHHQFAPSLQPGGSTFTVSGEDLGMWMDLEEKKTSHPGTAIKARVEKLLKDYQFTAQVTAPTGDAARAAQEYSPSQQETDWAYLRGLAEDAGFAFFIANDRAIKQKPIAWFGPRERGIDQKALLWNTGATSNLLSISFEYDPTGARRYTGTVAGEGSQTSKVASGKPTKAAMSKNPTVTTYPNWIRTHAWSKYGDPTAAGGSAQALADRSAERTVTGRGELDSARYGGVLEAHAQVLVSGVGTQYDGSWYVSQVTHSLKRGEYRQSFVIERDGTGAKGTP